MKKQAIYQLYGQLIQVARKEKNITASQLAALLCEKGYNFEKNPKQRISQIERGIDTFSLDLFDAICASLEVDIFTELRPVERSLFL